MRYAIFILALIVSTFSFGQHWNQLTYDADVAGLERNPLKGFATMFNLGGAVDTFPHSIRGNLFAMDDIMLAPGDFQWNVIDDFLDEQTQSGNHVFFQVNIDPANGTSWMPQFIKEQMTEDDWYFLETTSFNPETMEFEVTFQDSIPNWNNQLLYNSMLELVDSMGARYNGDPRIFMVQIGLYGSWGEWNIPGEAVQAGYGNFQMSDDKQLELASRFEAAFPDNYILARYPDNMPDPQTYGYSDGLFFAQSIDASNPFYFDNLLKASRADENWRLHPIGGEIRPEYQRYIWDQFPNQLSYPDQPETPQDVYDCLDSIRPTWLFAHHVIIKVLENSPGNTTTTLADPQDDPAHIVNVSEWENAMRANKALGYTLSIDSCRITSENGHPGIEVNFRNSGLAPMYCDWSVEFAAIDQTGALIPLGSTDWNIYSIIPDVEQNYRSFISEETLSDGVYTFLLRIVNPLSALSENAADVTFANSTMDEHMEGWLTLGIGDIQSGLLGQHPIQVEGVSLNTSSLLIPQGLSDQLTVVVVPQAAENKALTWISDHPGSVSVDQEGTIKAIGEVGDTAMITAYTQDGGFSAQCLVTIEVFVPSLPARIQAEDFVDFFGVNTEPTGDIGGGLNIGNIFAGHWMDYDVVNPSASNSFLLDIRAASGEAFAPGGTIELRDATGLVYTSITFSTNDGWQTYSTFSSSPFSLPQGQQRLRIHVVEGRFNLNWIEFRLVPCEPPYDLDVLEIGFGTATPRVNASWTNPEGTTDCEVRGGRIAPNSFNAGTPEFSNINNTRSIYQTNGSTVNFNITLFNNPNIPFVVGSRYGFEVRCACADGSGFSDWSGITMESTFIVPDPPSGAQASGKLELSGFRQKELQVIPNPNNGLSFFLKVDIEDDTLVQLDILDTNGRLIWQTFQTSKSLKTEMVPNPSLVRGLYILQMTSLNSVFQTSFVVH
jgi:hypothetical protein